MSSRDMELVLIGIIVLLLIKLGLIKQELRHMREQLQDYSRLNKRKKIDINLIDKDIENLAQSINEHITRSTQLQIKQCRSEDELKRMIANISHDLRTPLTSIIGYLQVLRSNEISEKRKTDYLETTYRRAKDLQRLIADFFTLSLVESPDYQINLEYVNLGNILCEVLASYYDSFIEKKVVPLIELPDEPIRIIGDTIALKRVLENLMTNITKYTTGEVLIRLTTDEYEVILTLINKAENLTTKDVDNMFERFYIADTSRGLNGGSTGLGLAIVKELMIKMQGNITSYIKEEQLYIECRWQQIK